MYQYFNCNRTDASQGMFNKREDNIFISRPKPSFIFYAGISGSEEGKLGSANKDGRFFSQHECLVHDEKQIGGICRDERIHKYLLRKTRGARQDITENSQRAIW